MMVNWYFDIEAPDLECSNCGGEIERWSWTREWPDGTVEIFCNDCGEDRDTG